MRATVLASLLLFGCASAHRPRAAETVADDPDSDACPQPGKLDARKASEACEKGSFDACERECAQRHADACFVRGLLAERADEPTSASWFRRACVAGSAIACTNFAATGFAKKSPLDGACMLALFESACAAEEPFGCGMIGRMYAEGRGVTADPGRAKKQLDQACTKFGGFPCHFLGLYLADGKLGPADLAAARTALERGCKTGYKPACASLDQLETPNAGTY